MTLVLMAFCVGLAVLPTTPHALHSRPVRQLNVRAVPHGTFERIYVYLPAHDESRALAVRDALVRAGAQRVNCFLPAVVTAEVADPTAFSAQFGAALSADWPPAGPERLTMADVTLIHEADLDSDVWRRSTELQWVRKSYAAASLLSDSRPPPEYQRPTDAAATGDDAVLNVPRDVVARTALAARDKPDARGIDQNSEFMIGHILAQLVFPESNGPGSTENWDDVSLARAAQLATGALLYYQVTYGSVDMRFTIRKHERVQTRTEPIQMTLNDEATWVGDVMTTLGFPDGTFLEQVHGFNEDARRTLGADWVFTAFIVNSENDVDHRFDGAPRNGWGYLGGPHLVLPYPVGAPREGDAPPDFAQNFKHEFGHMFWGLDEQHRVLQITCTHRSGYLNYRNGNKEQNINVACDGQSRSMCPMNIDDAAIRLYRGEPCSFTAGMFGLADDNNNGVPDALDAPPELVFESSGIDTIQSDETILRFRAISNGVPNRNSWQEASERVTYAPPVGLVARSRQGVVAEQLTPVDGTYDEVEEEFEYRVTALRPGMSRIRFITRNAAQATSPEIVKRVYYIGLSYDQFTFDLRNTGTFVSWMMLGETFDARFSLQRRDLETGVEETIATGLEPVREPSPPFTPYGYLDESTVPGRQYEYYVTGDFTAVYQGETTAFSGESGRHRVTAMIPIGEGELLSHVAPNPFAHVAWTSVNVPETRLTTSGGVTVPDRTAVEVSVYDVRGRRVKTLVSDRVFARVLTVPWDGTNQNGERVPSGVYFIHARAGSAVGTRKVVLAR